MRRLFSWLFNRTSLALLGLAILAILIWFGGDLIAIGGWIPLERPLVRLVLIALLFGSWLAYRLFRMWRERTRNAALIKELAKDEQPAAAGDGSLGTEEVAELRRRFETALATLRTRRVEGGKAGLLSRFTRRYVYQMPWYMFIGAPGSGKTTALVNSGLEFPLAEQFGKAAIRGIGGTRNCDWWFTNEAVLLDTAGRYTTQESNQALDKAEWEGFLKLLRRFRPKAPINGVIVAVGVGDLLSASDDEREHHAVAVRRRLTELYDTLKVRFPVYVVLTKTDLLGGFNEYFDRLTGEERAQVWGFTFGLDEAAGATALSRCYRTEHALLQKRIEDALPDLLQAEPDVQRRALIYAFTQQFAGLRDVLERFLQTLFAESKFASPPLFRGVYFTSGTQEGTPFDRVLGAIQRRFGVEARVQAASAVANTGRSYFLKGLLRDLVFPEAHLVTRNPERDRRLRIIQAVGIATCVLLLIGMGTAWFVSYANNRAYLAEILPKALALAKQVQETPNTTDEDPAGLLPILNDARNLARSTQFDVANPPLSYRFGLYQGPKVVQTAASTYDRLLEELLLPRIALRLERLLREAPADNLEALYGRLKAYLMLHEPEHYRPPYLLAAVTADWQATGANALTKASQQELLAHFRQLLEGRVRVSPFPRDDTLIAKARAQLGRYTPAKRIYGQLKGSIAERLGANADFTLVNAVGPDAKVVFSRISQRPLDEGVPALFTREGYRALQERLNDKRLLLQLDETWVLGRGDRAATTKAVDLLDERLLTDIRIAYLTEYRTSWDVFLADLRLVPTSNLGESIQVLRILSQPDSPMTRLIRVVSDETTLSETGKQTAGIADKATEVVKEQANTAMSRIFGSSQARIEMSPDQYKSGKIEQVYVDAYFQPWRRLAASPAQGGQDVIKPLLAEAYTSMVATEAAQRSGNMPPPNDTNNKLRAEAARLPIPLRGMIESLATSSSAQVASVTRGTIGSQLDATVGDFCRKAIAGRYPFNRGSPKDVHPDDFGRMFAAGGLMDDFFQKNLASLVDISTRPWSFKKGSDGTPVGTSASLVAFERAAVIRDALFRAGGRTPQLRIEIKPLEMDPSITQMTLDVDGQVVRYTHGPQASTTVVWPGPRGNNLVSLQLTPQQAGGSGTKFEGPWALHRFFDSTRMTASSVPERFNAEINVDGRRVTLEINAGSVLNPLRLRELESFACPARL